MQTIANSVIMRLQKTGMQKTTLLLAFACVIFCVASAQDNVRARYGVFGHLALNSHNADFFNMPGTQSCCSGYTGGSGTGVAGGALAEFPLASGRLHIGARIALLTQPFTMTSSEPTRVIVAGVAQDGAFEHRLTGSLTTLGFEPLIGLRLFSSLFVHAGARIAFALSSSYEQLDALSQPTGTGTFMNADGTDSRKRTRNEYSGTIPETALQVSPMVGISYELPLNKEATLLLVPEAFYQIGVVNVMSDSTWKASSFRAGIALKWSPAARKQEQPVEPERKLEPTVADASSPPATYAIIEDTSPAKLVATLEVNGLTATGAETQTVRYSIEEYLSTLMTPLLPYVFFDENTDRIPARYHTLSPSATSSFGIDRVNAGDKLSTYHQLLNIVGKRLRTYPDATITITGNNQDVGEEKGNTLLSSRRAESVSRYLVEVWGIASKRIKIDARSLPAKAANTQTQDGAEENRRAELYSDDARILAPIITSDTLRTSNPPSIRFRPRLNRPATLRSWNLSIKQNDKVLKSFTGTTSLPENIDWNLDTEKTTLPRTDAQVVTTFTAVDDKGVKAVAEEKLDVEQITIRRKKEERRGDKIVDRFSLILFDIRSSELQREHNPALDIIRRHVAPTSTVSITGYTDRLGDARFNQQLAESRAAVVASALTFSNATTEGIGQADLYDSTLPEGRLYTRTVNVIIETPVKE